MADGFRRGQSRTARQDPVEQRSAAVVFVVKALVDAGMRAKSPERTFPGFTDVEDLAAAAVGLFDDPRRRTERPRGCRLARIRTARRRQRHPRLKA